MYPTGKILDIQQMATPPPVVLNAPLSVSKVDLAVQVIGDNSASMSERVKALNELQMLSQAPGEELSKFLAGESLSLSNPLNDQCCVYQKICLVQSLMSLLMNGEDSNAKSPSISTEMKLCAIDILRNLSRYDLNRLCLFRIPLFVDVMQRCVLRGETPVIKELALVTLNNLALDEFIASRVLDVPGYLKMLVDEAEFGEAAGVRKWCLGNLRNIAVSPMNALRMCDRPFFIDETILRCVRSPNNPVDVKETALWALVNLSCAGNNRVRLFSKAYVMETLVECAKQAETRKFALRCLLSFAYAEQNRRPMFFQPMLVDTVVDSVENVSQLIVGKPDTDKVMAEWKEDSFRILYELSAERDLARAMYTKQRRLVYAMLDIVNSVRLSKVGDGASPDIMQIKLTSWTLTLLKSLGCTGQHVKFFNIMVTLCSVRSIPRLGRQSTFKYLSSELLREIAQTLVPKSSTATVTITDAVMHHHHPDDEDDGGDVEGEEEQ
jgi:hypothetical protein